ncbi:TerF vWA domain-containing protein [Streptomyces sp. SceaMP-e96]|uniref:vWA domain-containing protein n=1 Tax=unclassified Streptomyces TaxID=2593676 RepID=UPI000823F436|nr:MULTISPECIES: VWA domain-containing protein [unclassified Streptomyces]MYT14195.1 VWA domain-containing protein [Streptomyces sp. SID4951]SCK58385.1 TerF vWA domain-containing protein [Streptomyces sp. SceaMP-e96]
MGIRSLLRNAFGRSKATREETGAAPSGAVKPESATIPEAREESTPAPATPEAEVPAARTAPSEAPVADPAPTTATLPAQGSRADRADRAAAEPASDAAATATPSAPAEAVEAVEEAKEPEAGPAKEAAAAQDDAVADLVSQAFDNPNPAPTATAEPAADSAEPEPEVATEAKAEPAAEPETKAVAEPEAEPETKAPAEPEVEAVAKAVAEPEADAEPEPVAEPASEPAAAEAESESDKKAAAEPEPVQQPEPEAEAKPEPVAAEAQPATEPEATPEPAPEAEAKPAAEQPKDEPKAAEPKTAEPKTTEPKAAAPEAGQPAADQPDAEPQAEPEAGTAPVAAPAAAASLPSVAPALVSLYKSAGSTLDKHGLATQRAAVYLVLDRSGSMRNYYKDGTVQNLAEQALGLSAHLDDDATVPVIFFSTDIDGTAEIDLTNYEGRIEELHSGLGHMGRTNYHWAINAVVEHYKKSGATAPAFVIFQTDGAPTSKPAAEKALCEAAGLPIFWQFIGFGDPDAKGFDFLRKLDDLAVPEKRAVDNAGFFHAGRDPRSLSHDALYQQLMVEFPEWLAEARTAGVLKDS